MTVHRVHPVDGETEAILYDHCERCKQHAEVLWSLDREHLQRLWERSLNVETEDYHSSTEGVAARRLAEYVGIVKRVALDDEPLKLYWDARADRPNEIATFMHCTNCLIELGSSSVTDSPKAYARTQTGITASGAIQIWCNRHEKNVAVLQSRPAEGLSYEKVARED